MPSEQSWHFFQSLLAIGDCVSETQLRVHLLLMYSKANSCAAFLSSSDKSTGHFIKMDLPNKELASKMKETKTNHYGREM
jgi:hypothetical protein